MHASLSIAQRNASNAGNRQRRIDRMIVLKDSAVAMRRVFAQAHVRCQVEFREQFPKPPNSLNDRAIFILCLCPEFILYHYQNECQECAEKPSEARQNWATWVSVAQVGLTLGLFTGTPNRMTLSSPFFTSGSRNSSRRSMPHRR